MTKFTPLTSLGLIFLWTVSLGSAVLLVVPLGEPARHHHHHHRHFARRDDHRDRCGDDHGKGRP